MSSVQSVGAPREKLVALEKIEKDICSAMQTAGQAFQELSKDKPGQKMVESHTSNFLKTLQEVENGLGHQISYLTQVSTGQPHEGSSYASQKDLQMAYHRLEHVKSRLGELDKTRQDRILAKQQQQNGGVSAGATTPGGAGRTSFPMTEQQLQQPLTPQQQQQRDVKPQI